MGLLISCCSILIKITYLRARLVTFFLLCGFLGGCGVIAQVDSKSEAVLKDRVEQRWQALSQGRFDLAYQYQTPGFREIYSEQAYKGKFGSRVKWNSGRVKSIQIEGDRAEVVVFITYVSFDAYGSPIQGERPVSERWVYLDDFWWFSNK